MSTKKQKRQEGERRARQRAEEERQRQAEMLRIAQDRRAKRQRQRLLAEHAAENTQKVNKVKRTFFARKEDSDAGST